MVEHCGTIRSQINGFFSAIRYCQMYSSNDRGIWLGSRGAQTPTISKAGGKKKISLNQEVNGYVWNQRSSLFTFFKTFLIMRACSPLSSPLTKLLASLIYSYTSEGVLTLTYWLRLMCQSGARCLYVEGLVSELALYKKSTQHDGPVKNRHHYHLFK